MSYYYDESSDCIISEKQLKEEFEALQKIQPEEFDYSFSEYIANCTSKNGLLRRVGRSTKGEILPCFRL